MVFILHWPWIPGVELRADEDPQACCPECTRREALGSSPLQTGHGVSPYTFGQGHEACKDLLKRVTYFLGMAESRCEELIKEVFQEVPLDIYTNECEKA